jgi:hypothetical protein
MAEYDHVSDVKVVMAITSVAATAIANGSDIDTKGFESVTFLIHTGTLGTGTIDFTMQEADDDGTGSPDTYAAVAAVDIIGALPTILASEDDSVFRSGYRGKKRWVRIQNVETAGWTSMIHGAVCLLGHAKEIPVAAQIT